MGESRRLLRSILRLASTDPEFRARLLQDPGAALQERYGVRIPESFRISFVERPPGVNALIVLPDFHGSSDSASDRAVERLGEDPERDTSRREEA